LSTATVLSLATDRDGFLYAGTEYQGVYRSAETTTSVVSDRTGSPLGIALLQNYPNPFNPVTIIRYSIGAVSGQQSVVSSHVRLAVYDLLGREVAVLVDEKKAPGSYEVKFDGSRLASGVYFYRMQAGDFVQTRRLLLLK
jgi:hypothetical protein